MADLDYAAQLEAAYQQQQVSRAANAQRQAEEAQRQQAAADAAAAEAERTRGRTWGELAGDVGAGALQSAVGLGGAAYGLANVGTLGFLDRATGFSQNLSETQDILESYKSAPLQAKKAEMQQTFKQDGVGSGLAYTLQNPSIIADLATQSAAYLIPGAAAARAAGGLAAAGAAGRGLSQAAGSQLAQKAATKASLLSQAALSGGYMNVDGVNAARKAGMSENEVQLAGLAAGAAGALLNTAITKVTGAGSLEAMAAQRFGGAVMPTVAGSAARQIAGGTVKEATEEALQEGSENAIRNVAAGRPAGEGAGMNMALGGLLGGALGGVMGAANVRRPSQTRDQIAQQQREVERELAGAGLGSFTPSTLVESPLSALTGGRDQARYDFAGNQLDLAGSPLGEQGATLNYGQPTDMQPTVQPSEVAPGQGALFDEAGQPTREEINLDEAGLPLAGQLPQVEELTGARAVIAARQARLASQPPRMGVAELAADEVAIDALPRPAVETQSLREVMRSNAPIGKVLELFGPEAAGVEAARRAQVSTVPGEVATERAPIDLTTDVAAKKYKAQLSQAFRAAGVDISSSAANRAELDEIAAQVASAGVRPTDADFAQVVGAAAERVASSRGAENAGVSALIAGRYPIDPETQAAIRAGAEFDRMVAEPAPVQPTKDEAIAEAVGTGLVPASAVTKMQTGQVWVDSTGAEHTVVGVIDGKPLVRGPDGRKKPMYLSAMRKNNWSVKAQPVVEGLDAQAVGDLRTLLASTYWQERGGKLLRDQGLEGDVVGRTEWLSSVPEVQAVLSGTGYDAADVSALLDRAATGQGKALTAKQVSLVEGVLAAMQDMRQQQTTDTPATAPDTSLPAFDAYEQLPAAPVIDAIAAGRAEVASLNPTFDGMIGALDAAQTVADASAAAFAARQHPTYIQMSPEDTLAFEHHLAEVMASLNGIKFHLADAMPRAVKQTDTPAFKRWFGDSKVVDAQGNPQVVWHGAAADFDSFDTRYAHPDDPDVPVVGFHLSTDEGRARGSRPDQNRQFFVAIKNPATKTEAFLERRDLAGELGRTPSNQEVTDRLVAKGYDGVIMSRPWDFSQSEIDSTGRSLSRRGSDDGYELVKDGEDYHLYGRGDLITTFESVEDANETGDEFHVVAFKPTQIKSATGNSGAFDPANPDIRFKQGAAGAGVVSDVIFRGLTAAASRQTGIPTVAHVDVANAEYVVGYAIPANARGFYDPATGTIHIIQSNNADRHELAFTLAHEAGHAGLDKLLGANLQSAMNRMWANAPMRERIKAHMAQNPGMTRQLAAEEVLADMLAGGEKINTDVMTKLRNGVRNFFARLVGIRDLVVTNEEVDRLLADVALVINGEQPVSVKIGGQDASLWLNNPSSIAAQNPKFSLANADYEAMVAAAKNEPASNVLPISHIAKALGQASVDSAKQAGNALTENKMGRAYVRNFMHLDHLVSWYDKKFNPTGAKTGGFLRKVADLKQGREAQFNRLNAKQKDLTYKTVVNGNEVLRAVGKKSVNDVNESWDKFKRSNPDKARALDFALTEGTFYQVFPDRSWSDQVTKDFDYEGKGYTEAERLAAYERASNAYKAAGTEGQTLYMQSQAVYAQRFNEHYAAIKQEAERLGARAKADAEKNGVDVELVTARVDNATARYKNAIGRVMGKVQQGPYSPLQRYGEYVMTVRDKDGDVVHFSAYDTKSAADAAAAEILEARTAAGEKVNVNVSAAKDAEFDSTGVARGEIESIRNEVMGMLPAGLDADVRDKAMAAITAGLTEAYLQSLPAKSFAKHALGRKNVAGYDTDALRAFANYTMRSARAVAGVEYDGRIANSLMDVQTFVDDTAKGKYTDKMGVVDTAQLQNIADAVKKQHKESLRSDSNKIVDSLTGASFIYMMTSPSHMLFNATQTAMVAFPRLAGVYGAGKASKEIRKALGEYFRSGTDMLSEKSVLSKSAQTNPADALLLESLTAIKENGPLDLTQAHDAAGIADGSSSDLSPYWGKTMKWASYAMHKSEVFNRQITATAAIRLELEKALAGGVPPADPAARAALVADLVRAGEDAIRTTQFDYSKANKPPILQGPMGKLLGQFQQYRFHMLSMIGKDIRDAELGKLFGEPINKEEAAIARSTLAWTLGMQLAFTGTAGTIIAPFAFALADMWREDDDLTTSAQAWSNMVGSFAAHGVFAGLIDTSRISASTLIPVLGQTAYAPIDGKPGDTFTYYVTQNLGPSFGLVKNLTGGTSDLINGDVAKAVGKLLPKPFADAHKAYYEGANGARDSRQIMYYEPGPFDLLVTAVGLKSGERRGIEERRGALYTANANRFAIKDRNLGRLALAYSTGDADAIAEAMQGINDWNAQYPDMAVRGSEMRSAVVSRIRTERTAADTGFSSTRAPTQSLVEKIGQ
jgi:hypothetical protein